MSLDNSVDETLKNKDEETLKNNFVNVPPLNQNFEENIKAFERLFRKGNHVVNGIPDNAEILAIDNLSFIHTKLLPIPVYVELKTDSDNKKYSNVQLSLLNYFTRGWIVQIRPFTVKTIPNHGLMFLGVICMVPYFKLCNIVKDTQETINWEKSEIKFLFCRGTQLLTVFQDNVCSILNMRHTDPMMPKRKKCRHYQDLNVFHNYSLRNFLSGITNQGKSQTLIEMPWVDLDRETMQKQVLTNRKPEEVNQLKHIWPTKRICCPISDQIWEKPTPSLSSTPLTSSITLYYVASTKNNIIRTFSSVFSPFETVPFWVQLAQPKPPLQPKPTPKPKSKPPKAAPKRAPKAANTKQPKQQPQKPQSEIAPTNNIHTDSESSNKIPFTVEREFSL